MNKTPVLILSGVTLFSVISMMLLIIVPVLIFIYLCKYFINKYSNYKIKTGMKFIAWSLFIAFAIAIIVFVLIINGKLNFMFST